MIHREVTKAATCRRYGWTLYQFDQLVREGFQIIAAPARKGGEWRIDPDAADAWVRKREARVARLHRVQAAMEARQEAARDEAKLQHEAAERAAQRNRVAEFSRRSADAEHE